MREKAIPTNHCLGSNACSSPIFAPVMCTGTRPCTSLRLFPGFLLFFITRQHHATRASVLPHYADDSLQHLFAKSGLHGFNLCTTYCPSSMDSTVSQRAGVSCPSFKGNSFSEHHLLLLFKQELLSAFAITYSAPPLLSGTISTRFLSPPLCRLLLPRSPVTSAMLNPTVRFQISPCRT